MNRLQQFWDAQAEWSQATFGPDTERGPIGPLKHLLKEIEECLKEPDSIEERADCVFLIFDATRCSGHGLLDLLAEGWFVYTGRYSVADHLRSARDMAERALVRPSKVWYVACAFAEIIAANHEAGYTREALVSACFRKLEINKARKWVRVGPDQPIEHERKK